MDPLTQPSGTRYGLRIGRRLGLRVVLQLVLLSAAVGGAVAWVTYNFVDEMWAEDARHRLEQQQSTARAVLVQQQQAVVEALERFSQFLQRFESARLAELMVDRTDALDQAQRWTPLAGLPLLEVRLAEGADDPASQRVLTSAIWPERVGLETSDFRQLAPGTARPVLVETAERSDLALMGTYETPIGSRRVHLYGGVWLEPQLLSRMGGGATVIVNKDGSPLTIASIGGATGETPTTSASASHALARELVARQGQPLDTMARAADFPWELSVLGLPNTDGAKLVLGLDRAAQHARLSQLARMLALTVLGASLFAGVYGWFVSRRVTRPVHELIRAVDAVAAGQADYTFTRQTQDEFEELVSAFSRLHRSLGIQEAKTRAAERVAAWREVARHVAHEVKNPLAPIRLTIQNLMRARMRGHPQWDTLWEDGAATILDEVERLSRLVGEFSNFARLPLPRRQPTDLVQLVGETTALFAAEPRLHIETQVAVDLPLLELDPDQMAQALQNVIGNAVQSMHQAEVAEPRLELTIDTEDSMARVTVVDNGPGFSQEALQRVFEPYFTTKDEGTGLGMAITYRIVAEHDGVIEVENAPHGGAVVSVRLPLPQSLAEGSSTDAGRTYRPETAQVSG